MRRLIVLLLVLLPLPVCAEIYSWTDAAGTVHFTEDIGSIPKKYRAQAVRKAAGEKSLPIPQPAGEAVVSKPPLPAAAAPGAASGPQAAPTDTPAGPATSFGGRSAAEWQQEFRALRSEMQKLEEGLEEVKRDGGDGKKFLTPQQIVELNSRNKKLYGQHEALRLRYNKLVEQANQAGLPAEFAQ